nr:MAG TPA: hypothetical protein [Caudoviricetes sp.]
MKGSATYAVLVQRFFECPLVSGKEGVSGMATVHRFKKPANS